MHFESFRWGTATLAGTLVSRPQKASWLDQERLTLLQVELLDPRLIRA